MSITNLTNTSWYFNEEVVSCGISNADSPHIGEDASEWHIDIVWYDVHHNSLYFEFGMANNVFFDTLDENGSYIQEQWFEHIIIH